MLRILVPRKAKPLTMMKPVVEMSKKLNRKKNHQTWTLTMKKTLTKTH